MHGINNQSHIKLKFYPLISNKLLINNHKNSINTCKLNSKISNIKLKMCQLIIPHKFKTRKLPYTIINNITSNFNIINNQKIKRFSR